MIFASKNVHPRYGVGSSWHLIHIAREFENIIGSKIQSSVRRYQFHPDRLTIPESEEAGRLGTDIEIVPMYMQLAIPLVQSNT